MAGAVIGEGALLGLPADGVGQAQVRVADDPEDVPDVPVDQRLDDDVRDRAFVWLWRRKADVDPVGALLDGIGSDAVVVGARRLAGQRIEIPAVPGTAQPAGLDRSLPEGAALMGTRVLEGGVLAPVVGQRNGRVPTRDGGDAARRKLVLRRRPVPRQLLAVGPLAFVHIHPAVNSMDLTAAGSFDDRALARRS